MQTGLEKRGFIKKKIGNDEDSFACAFRGTHCQSVLVGAHVDG